MGVVHKFKAGEKEKTGVGKCFLITFKSIVCVVDFPSFGFEAMINCQSFKD